MADKFPILPLIAIAGGGYLLWKSKQTADQAAAGTDLTPAEVLPPNTQILPGIGPVLVPPVAVGTQTFTQAVQTPYGAVIPSNFNSPSTASTATANAATSARAAEIILRHQYIFNSIAYALSLWQANPAAKDSGADSRIATLRAKDAALQSEYMTYSGGKPIPDGTVMGNAANRAAYVAFLQKQGWCDPLVGVQC